ncbi:MAG: CvpA family protein, partial [Erysipelotrichales bacterium]|nr:CvpA family protein [Erysipelotrichales bacterium]
GQKNVVNTTDGYNYTVMNDDVYLYTGITSKASDESNLGFILSNLRTKETHFYSVPGAEEYSAMASAQGQVQQMGYEASFPLLINLNNKATYLISLKDNAGLVKMYAFVDVADYQKVVVSDASLGIEAAAKKYIGDVDIVIDESEIDVIEIMIAKITDANIEGNTYYYFEDMDRIRYRASIAVAPLELPFLESGDVVELSYYLNEGIREVIEIN